MLKLAGVGIEDVESGIAGAHQQLAVSQVGDVIDGITDQAVWITRHVAIMLEGLGVRIVEVESVRERCDPQPSPLVLADRLDVVSRQALWILGIVPEDLEGVSIVAIEPVARGYPHIALRVLD